MLKINKYVILTVFVLVFVGFKFLIMGNDKARVEAFRGANLDTEVWNPIIANEVNSNVIKIQIDGKEYNSSETNFYMDKNRNIMIPVSMLRDSFNCSAHIYEESLLLVEKHNLSVYFALGESVATNGEKEVETLSPLTKNNSDYYVSLGDLAFLLNYTYDMDIAKYTVTTADKSEDANILPARYDMREKNRVSTIRNQGKYGTCWAFAALSAIESTLKPEENQIFSVDNMSMSNAFHMSQYDGGDYTMGMAYLAAWNGPVYEKDDPYGDGKSEVMQPVKHVQEMRIIESKNLEAIKKAVFQYGGVQTSLYTSLKSSQGSSQYYNKKTTSYCYIGTAKPNHDVVIIGWDDNYSKDNFTVPLEGDGAFICQNSWGDSFGEDGIFYVSYYDSNIGTHNVVYTKIEDTDNYDHIYQSDLCGWIGKIGYEKEDIYGANVFTATGNQTLEAAGFYATGINTEYDVYVVNSFINAYSFQSMHRVASGTLEQAGYYTVDFRVPVQVAENERYAIVVYLKTPGATHPMAIEYDTGDSYLKDINLDDGEGYISSNGSIFNNVKDLQNCNLCIKAYTDDK